MNSKKAQIQVTFNWIYIMIAGAVILLFFVGIVVKQKAASEQKLNQDIVRIMESIFTGATVSEKTKNFIDTSGLADMTLYFNCEDGVSEYGISGTSAKADNSISAIFSPREISTNKLIVWSLPYQLPFKVMDFLLITSVNTKYFLVGDDIEFATEFVNATGGFNVKVIPTIETAEAGKNFQIRIVDLDGSNIAEGSPVPSGVRTLDDDKVTAVSFVGVAEADYYQMKDGFWEKLNRQPVQIVSIAEERDTAKYAAIFAADHEIYRCNMNKAMRRIEYLNMIYGGEDIARNEPGGKVGEMISFYEKHPELPYSTSCLNYVNSYELDIVTSIGKHQRKVEACREKHEICNDLVGSAQDLQRANRNLAYLGDCITLY